MAKVYIVTDRDLETLLLAIDRDPAHGHQGGSSSVLSDTERQAHNDAHRFYNYQVRAWVDRIKR